MSLLKLSLVTKRRNKTFSEIKGEYGTNYRAATKLKLLSHAIWDWEVLIKGFSLGNPYTCHELLQASR